MPESSVLSLGCSGHVIRDCVGFIKWIDMRKKNACARYTRGQGVEGGGVVLPLTPLYDMNHSFPRTFTLNQIYSTAPQQKFGSRDLWEKEGMSE